MPAPVTVRTTGEPQQYVQNLDKNSVKDRLDKSDSDWKAGRAKGMDVVTIATLAVFAVIVIFIVVMIIL